MAASPAGGRSAARSRGDREDRPPGACSSAARFGEIAPVFVSEGVLDPRSGWYITETVIYHQSKITRNGAPGPAFPPENSGGAV